MYMASHPPPVKGTSLMDGEGEKICDENLLSVNAE